MNKLFTWAVRIAVLAVLIKLILWSWAQYQGSEQETAGVVSDWDTECSITNPDTGSCVCVHRDTGERLKVGYEKCVKLAREKR